MSEVRPGTKLAQLREFWLAGDREKALAMAARFPRLGDEKVAIERAWAALSSPELYRGMGHDVDKLVEDGYAALRRRYELP